jgi:thiol-disulfide isomerase/thioredoxin
MLLSVFTLTIIIVTVYGGWYMFQQSRGELSPEFEQEHPGILATDFSVTDLDGINFTLSDYIGKVVVINFMATWCGACTSQMPNYGTIHERYGDAITLMTIDIDPRGSEETLRNYSKEFPYATWIWARDTTKLGVLYEVEYIPKTILIDPDGYIRFEHIGVTDSSTFITEIEELLS